MSTSWRFDHSEVGTWTHFAKQVYLVGTIGISAYFTHKYLQESRKDLPLIQKNEFKLSYSLYALRAAFRFFYVQKLRVIANHELLLSPFVIPATYFLPIYFANKAETTDNGGVSTGTNREEDEEDDGKVLKSNLVHYIGIGLTVVGHLITLVSEYQRTQFKSDNNNNGKLYTDGLNAYSRHPNYLGNIVVYTGLSSFSRNAALMLLPAISLLQYYYYHIPELEDYLSKRYTNQWDQYKKSVKALIPMVL